MKRGWCPTVHEPMPSGDGLLIRVKPLGGRLSAAMLRTLAGIAASCGNGAIELTGRGNIQLRGLTRRHRSCVLRKHLSLPALPTPIPSGRPAATSSPCPPATTPWSPPWRRCSPTPPASPPNSTAWSQARRS